MEKGGILVTNQQAVYKNSYSIVDQVFYFLDRCI